MSSNRFLEVPSLDIALGRVRSTSHFIVNGANPSIDNNTTASLCPVASGIYPWSVWDTAGVVTVDREDSGDADKVIAIHGLDADWNTISDTVTLASATGNASSMEFKRINSVVIMGPETNVGDITIKKGATAVDTIAAGHGRSLNACYSIPAGYDAFILWGEASSQYGADATGFMHTRTNGQSFIAAYTFEVGGSASFRTDFTTPLKVESKSDIDIRMTTRSNNGRFTASYSVLLVKHNV